MDPPGKIKRLPCLAEMRYRFRTETEPVTETKSRFCAGAHHG
jgi:hypothetical protein